MPPDEQPALEGSLDSAARAIEALLARPETNDEPEQPNPAVTQEAPVAETQAEETEEKPAESESAAEAPTETIEASTEVSKPEPQAKPNEAPEVAKKLMEADQAIAQSNAARDQLLNQLNTLIPQFEASLRGDFADIKTEDDVLKLMSDPDRYNAYIIAQAKLNRAVSAQRELAAKKFAEWQTGEKAKLHTLLPDLKDPEKGQKLSTDIITFAKKHGYSDQQIGLASANDVALIHKAMLYENGEAQRVADATKKAADLEKAKVKAAGAPPVQKPGVARPNTDKNAEKAQDDLKRLQKSGRVDDAALVMQHILG